VGGDDGKARNQDRALKGTSCGEEKEGRLCDLDRGHIEHRCRDEGGVLERAGGHLATKEPLTLEPTQMSEDLSSMLETGPTQASSSASDEEPILV
jgi:hypothetical protein